MKLIKLVHITILVVFFELWNSSGVSGSCSPLIPRRSQNVQVTCFNSIECKKNGKKVPTGSRAGVKCFKNYEIPADGTNGRKVMSCHRSRWVRLALFDEMQCKIKCGRPTVQNVGHVVNGTVSERLKWPWHVAIFTNRTEGEGWSYICGGSIINPIGNELLILTAVHCFKFNYNPSNYKVVAGAISSNLSKNSRTAHTQILNIADIIIHESYEQQRHLEDIALMKTKKSIKVTDYVFPVCLPSNKETLVNNQLDAAGVNTTGVVVGFGSQRGLKGPASEKLHEITIPIRSNPQECGHIIGQIPTSTQICAGTPDGVNTCSGDSGGGLLLKENNPFLRYTIEGIVSSAPQDSQCQDLSLFTKVSKFIDWIESKSDNLITRNKNSSGTDGPTLKPTHPRINYEEIAVSLHNDYRKKINDTHLISIDPKMSQIAQKWAEHLIETNTLKTGAGCYERVYDINGSSISPNEAIKHAFNTWYDLKPGYNTSDPNSIPPKLIFEISHKLGTGISSKDGRTVVVVCYSGENPKDVVFTAAKVSEVQLAFIKIPFEKINEAISRANNKLTIPSI